MNSEKWQLDPRCGLVLLLLSNVLVFFGDRFWLQVGWLLLLSLLMFLNEQGRSAIKGLLLYAFFLFLLRVVLPVAPKWIATSFAILINYNLKIFPCLMIGWLMVKVVSMQQLVAALRCLHVPKKLIVAVSVTLRYIPAIREETNHIRSAMKLRNIRGMKKFEAVVIPLMISATATAEELSAAAVTRGIENPVKKTSVIQLRLCPTDYFFITVGSIYLLVGLIY